MCYLQRPSCLQRWADEKLLSGSTDREFGPVGGFLYQFGNGGASTISMPHHRCCCFANTTRIWSEKKNPTYHALKRSEKY